MQRLSRLPVRIAVVAAVVVLGACATSGSSSSSSRGSRDLIVLEELTPLENLTAREAIQRLRPQWLQFRGGNEPVIFMDGSQVGGPEFLRSVSVGSIAQIRFRNGRDATTRYGTGFGGGTIEITTR